MVQERKDKTLDIGTLFMDRSSGFIVRIVRRHCGRDIDMITLNDLNIILSKIEAQDDKNKIISQFIKDCMSFYGTSFLQAYEIFAKLEAFVAAFAEEEMNLIKIKQNASIVAEAETAFIFGLESARLCKKNYDNY